MKNEFFRKDAYRERMVLKGILVLLTACFIGSFLWVSLNRIKYPYELEWCEAPVVEQALRIVDGEPYYVAPSLEWVTLIYTPLYFYLGSLVMKFAGDGFAALRFISIVSTIGIGIICYLLLRKMRVNDIFALTGIGLFFAGYSITGAWYDLARVDMAALLFAVAAVSAAFWGRDPLHAILCAVMTALAFLTKQSFLLIALLFIPHWFLTDRKSFRFYLTTIAILFIGATAYLYLISDGLFRFYSFAVPAKHHIFPDRWITFWTADLLGKFPIMFIFGAFAFYLSARKLASNFFNYRESTLVVMVVGFIAVSWMGRLKVGGYDNTLIPAVLAISLLTALTLQHFHLKEYNWGWILPAAGKTAIILQFILLGYRPWALIPPEMDRNAGGRVIETIESIEGEVFLPNHGYYARMTGKKTFAYWMALHDILHYKGDITPDNLPEDLMEAISNRRFSAIILDEPMDFWRLVITPYYYLKDKIFSDGEDILFWQSTGMPTRPQFVFVPKSD